MEQKQVLHDRVLLSLLNLMSIVSAMGYLLCLIIFVRGNYQTSFQVLAYLIWFSVAMLSAYMMKNGDRWGAYALGVGTLSLTLYELYLGTASFGGALLGITIALMVIDYLMNNSTHLDQSQQLLS